VLILQLRESRIAYSPECISTFRSKLGGLLSELILLSPDGKQLLARDVVFAPHLAKRIDPAYDAWESERGDFLRWVFRSLNDPETVHHFLSKWEPSAE
jgi:hypothetical protein